MSSRQIYLLNSISDAESLLSETEKLESWQLIATHNSVVDHLHSHGFDCTEISQFLDQRDFDFAQQALYPKGQLYQERCKGLSLLDSLVPPDASEKLGMNFLPPLFSSMYGYLSHISFWGKHLLSTAVEKAVHQYSVDKVVAYSQEVAVGFLGLQDVLSDKFASSLDIEVEQRKVSQVDGFSVPVQTVRPTLATLVRSAFRRLRAMPEALSSLLDVRQVSEIASKRILLLLPEYDFHCLFEMSHPYELVQWTHEGPQESNEAKSHWVKTGQDLTNKIVGAFDGVFSSDLMLLPYWKRILNGVEQDGAHILSMMARLNTLIHNQGIDCAIWGNSPGALPRKNLMAQFLLRSGVPVIGGQHGGNYGAQDCGYGFQVSDFSHCTHFFSYGFTREDILEDCVDECDLEVVPIGSTRLYFEDRAKFYKPKKNRVVFPITNCFSVHSAVRTSPSVLAQQQREILTTLNDRPDLDVWIKPFCGASTDNLAWANHMQQMVNLQFAGGGFTWFLAQKQPELIVIEFPSSPLFEVLPLDVDIFLLFDPVLPFKANAEVMLRKRAHVFESVEEMGEAIMNYGHSPLPRLRDDTYYKTYVWRPYARENMIQEINKIVEMN